MDILKEADRIEKMMVDLNDFMISTCDAPEFGWNLETHLHMPAIAEELRRRGFKVTVKVNHEVTDWMILRGEKDEQTT